MNTITITIGAILLGHSIYKTAKYNNLKMYYKRKCKRHDEANEIIAELQARIEVMSKNIDYLKSLKKVK